MLSKFMLAAMMAMSVAARPVDFDPQSLTERDPNALVKFYIPEAPPAVDDTVAPADVNKRFYIYPPPSDSSDDNTMPTKRDPNALVKFYIPEAPADSE